MNATNSTSERLSRVLFIILIALVLGITLSSCTMEKRLYRPGFHIESLDKRRAEVVKKTEPEVQIQKSHSTVNLSSPTPSKPVIANVVTPMHETKEEKKAIAKQEISDEEKVHTSAGNNTITEKAEAPEGDADGTKKGKKVHWALSWSFVSLLLFWPLFPFLLIYGIRETRKDPETYSMKKFWISLLITLIVIAVITVLMIVALQGIGFGMSWGC